MNQNNDLIRLLWQNELLSRIDPTEPSIILFIHILQFYVSIIEANMEPFDVYNKYSSITNGLANPYLRSSCVFVGDIIERNIVYTEFSGLPSRMRNDLFTTYDFQQGFHDGSYMHKT
jgi:hypothetical protein